LHDAQRKQRLSDVKDRLPPRTASEHRGLGSSAVCVLDGPAGLDNTGRAV
jgi:hypothetical protein